MMASGDLVGTGLSILDESNGVTGATFIWNVALTPPLLNNLANGSSSIGFLFGTMTLR